MTEQNKQPEESGLDLFRPTAEDERKGITGITMEQEIVSVATLRARKRRRRAIMLSAIFPVCRGSGHHFWCPDYSLRPV